MSTRPTEPGNYHWRASEHHRWRTIEVFEEHINNTRDDQGIWGPRIPDPDEPRAEPTGGLTAEEANHLYRLMVAHSFDTAVSSYRGHPDDPTLESVLSAELARIGFTRLTDAEIEAGYFACMDAHGKAVVDHYDDTEAVRCKIAQDAGIAAFRRAVAELREPKGNDPC